MRLACTRLTPTRLARTRLGSRLPVALAAALLGLAPAGLGAVGPGAAVGHAADGTASAPAVAAEVAAAEAAEVAAEPAPAMAITLTNLQPKAPLATDEVVLRGEVRNLGETPQRRLRVRLRVSNQPVRSRSALAAQAISTGAFGGPVAGTAAAMDLPDLPPDGRVTFAVRAQVAAMRLPGSGVYPIGVDVRGEAGDGVETLGRLRTWLPFDATAGPAPAGAGRSRPTSIAWLWPLVDLPDRRSDGTFPNDRLAASVRPSGRLGQLLAATAARPAAPPRTPPIPVTFAIDPALLEALAAMADGYRVGAAGGRTSNGTGRAAAAAFLSKLRQQTATRPVVALPYADPDLAALDRAGRAQDVGIATGSPTFRQLVRSVLPNAVLERIAWPPGGLAPASTIDAISTTVDTVVLSGAALPPLPGLRYTPDAATTLPAIGGGTLRALVSDPTLDQLVGADPRARGGVRYAQQRFLAETLLITLEQPSVSRAVVIAPPRRWAPPAGWAAALVDSSAQVPWLRPARLADLRPLAGAGTRGPLSYPAAAQRAELPTSVFTGRHGVGRLAETLDIFRAIVTNPSTAGVPALDRALLRGESSAWRTSARAGDALREDTDRTLKSVVAKVKITTKGTVSLASKRNTIPISIANGLNQPVRVQVDLNSTAALLVAEATGVKEIAGGHQLQLPVGLQVPGSGVFTVNAGLLTPDGKPFGTTEELQVYSSRYGALALAITGGAFAVLALTAAVRIGRRLRAARRPRHAQ